MTTYRSKAVAAIASALVIVGFTGFLVCTAITFVGQQRVWTTHEFDRPTQLRSAPIQSKGRVFFVEEDYARRYQLAEKLILPFFAMAFGIGIWSERRRLFRRWQSLRRKS
jgi:hypothetical protein